jgi:protein-tyrosine-phosphatase
MPSVLFVCTANRFRSPLAEAAFKKCLHDDGILAGWEVRSAGTWTRAGFPAAVSAQRAAIKMGLDIGKHRSQPVTQDLLSKSNLIIVMQASQREAILVEFPVAAGKTILLSEFAEGIPYDIPDPVEAVDDSDQVLATTISNLVHQGYNKICAFAQKSD